MTTTKQVAARRVFPVYNFAAGYMNRTYLFYAFDEFAALEFCQAYHELHPHTNGCYLAVSIELTPGATVPAFARENISTANFYNA